MTGNGMSLPGLGDQSSVGHRPSMGALTVHGTRQAKNHRFPKDFWISSSCVLTRTTPITKLNHFCVNHGFFLSDLAGFTADDKRASLYQVLDAHDWPDGYEGYMRARNEMGGGSSRPSSARAQRYENMMRSREGASSVPATRPHSARGHL